MVQYSQNNKEDQEFLWFSLDTNCFAVVNKNSGKVMDVNYDSKDNSAIIVQYTWTGQQDQQWIPQIQDNDFYTIKNSNSGKLLDVYYDKTVNNAPITQYAANGKDDQLWSFKESNPSFNLPSIQVSTLPNVPQYTSSDENLSSTTPIVTAYTLMPCIMVKDAWDDPTKIQSTPYYMMYKKQYWKNIDSHTFAPNTQYTSTTEYGMSQTDQTSMTETTSISVTADAGFSFGPLSSSVSTTVTNELQVSKSTTTELMTDQQITETIENPNDYEVSWTKFALVTEYYLARADGTVIGDWTVIDKNQERESYYPLDTTPLTVTSDNTKAVN
jgi:hypothetical protein